MAPGHQLALYSTRRLRLTEIACWIIAAFLLAMVLVLLTEDGAMGGLIPLTLVALLFGWQALRQRRLRRRLATLDWDLLRPMLGQLRGTVFEEVVNQLQVSVRGSATPPRIEQSDDGRRHQAIIELRPGLWVELQAKDALVRSVRISLGTAGSPVAAGASAPSLSFALALSAVLVLFDGIMFGQGILSLFIALGLLVGRLPFILFSRHTHLRRPRLRNLAVYLVAIAVVFALVRTNARVAGERADLLVTALKSYHLKYARYPAALDDLVPEFAREIPPAKFVLIDNRFRYIPREAGPLLYYTSLPPFGRRGFDFAENRWTSFD